jgi:signal transduction histidine kinase
MKFKMRDILLRKDLFIASQNNFKRAILTGYLALLSTLVGIFYTVYHTIYLIDDAYFGYYILIAGGLSALFLNRNGHHTFAKSIVLSVGTFVVFLFTTKSDFQTDAHFYYLILAMSSFAIFGYENRGFAIGYAVVVVGLFWFSFTSGFSILPKAGYLEAYVKSNQLINFTVGLLTSCIVLYFMVRLNFKSEEILNRKQEEISHQNQALTKANAELDRFVYSASHDMRAPLTSMLGLIHIARKTDDPAEIKQCLQMLESRVHRLDDFIHEIIDISRNARIDVIKQPINLKALLNEVLENLRYAKDASLQIDVHIPADLDFSSDPSRIKIILSNLIGNAFKYQDRRKEHPRVSIRAFSDQQGISLTIEDNGIGIAAEHHAKLFSMFYRASDQAEGSGLGLYITKEAVEKLSGTIKFQSVYGSGSTFSVWIPR